MKCNTWALSVAILATVLPGLCCMAGTARSEAAGSGEVVDGNTAFAVDLYRHLSADEGNLFISPYSISLAMGMTYGGARGNTAVEMAGVLHFPGDHEALHPAFRRLSRTLAETAAETGQRINIANALFLTGGDVSPGYKALLKDAYDAEIFRGRVDMINAWVEEKTEGKIDTILEQLSPDTVCAILNAIYFKGLWENPFDEDFTREAPFAVAPGKEAAVPLMYQKSDLKVLSKDGFRAASFPYEGERLSMVILLPDDADGLPALEEQLTPQDLKKWLDELDNTPSEEFDVYLPRFTLESEYDLVQPFKTLGMHDAFEENLADFTGMGWRKGELWIGQIKHKAFVEVNEEGTEAAAATAVEMITKVAKPTPVFRADHPFLFLIRDNDTGTLLFLGRLVDPTPQA